MSRYIALLAAGLLIHQPLGAEEAWTSFRGPSEGVSTLNVGPLRWNEQLNIRWQAALAGQGWSSPVCDGRLIWMTAAIVSSMPVDEQDAIRDAAYADHAVGASLLFVKEVEFRALAVDLETGKTVHDISLFSVSRPPPIHSLNSYASPTPVLHQGKLFCHFGSLGTLCLDTQSQEIDWRTRLPHDESVGPGSSPTLYRDLLIIPCDGVDQQYVVALDTADGAIRWKSPRPPMEGSIGEYHKAFSTPIIIEHLGRQQAIVVGAQWLTSYEPETGRELWRVRHGDGFSSSVVPVHGSSLVFICTGFGDGKMLAVDPGGSGDVTDSHVRWSLRQQVPTMPSPVLAGSKLFLASDNGVATCVDAATGASLWRKRLGGNFSSSPILIGDCVYFSNRDGVTTVIAAADEFRPLATNQLPGRIMASPIIADGDLIVRTSSQLYRIQTAAE